ncbi:hypothetical protein PN36_27780 [Candidatus Thiomargarita nelsonii]|uniref:Calcineurin-like phosphoesterase domain-containing protein n=1 Tax=Candidatus Thiomargarita nelsonii TaxID=1003181 RepID=A0A4E0QQ41_9GAMM|nr:hypothetical protein PN36_27780 [Candidatus Thiomargarita nelsonii]
MGAFPNPFKLDDATQKYAQIDPDELGFHKFCTQTEESEFYLARQNTPSTYFIRGNHEDFSRHLGFPVLSALYSSNAKLQSHYQAK